MKIYVEKEELVRHRVLEGITCDRCGTSVKRTGYECYWEGYLVVENPYPENYREFQFSLCPECKVDFIEDWLTNYEEY